MGIHDSAITEGHLQLQYHRTQARLPPAVVNMCRRVGWSLKWRLPQLLQSVNHEDRLLQEIKLGISQQTGPASVAGIDIEELVFLVMMEAAQDAQQDMNAIMDNVKATNNAKARLRDIINKQLQQIALRRTGQRRWPPW